MSAELHASTAAASSTTKDNWSPAVYSSNASFVYSPPALAPLLALIASPSADTALSSITAPTVPSLPTEIKSDPLYGLSILDLGCGTGVLTLLLADRASVGKIRAARVWGVDSSASLLAEARTSDTGEKVQWIQGDGMVGSTLGLGLGEEGEAWKREGVWGVGKGEADMVVSNAAMHWMKRDPRQVVRNAWTVLKEGGVFVGEVRNRFVSAFLISRSNACMSDLVIRVLIHE